MSRFLLSRVAKLEARKAKPPVVRGSVARFTPEGKLLGPVPNGACMAATDFGNDEAWSRALRRQQAQLTQHP